MSDCEITLYTILSIQCYLSKDSASWILQYLSSSLRINMRSSMFLQKHYFWFNLAFFSKCQYYYCTSCSQLEGALSIEMVMQQIDNRVPVCPRQEVEDGGHASTPFYLNSEDRKTHRVSQSVNMCTVLVIFSATLLFLPGKYAYLNTQDFQENLFTNCFTCSFCVS